MKLKRCISLVLILALSVMSLTFSVSAATSGADLNLVSISLNPKVTDSASLKKDDVFVVDVALSDISAKQIYSGMVEIKFDPSKLQVVDGTGKETTKVTDAFVPCADVYNASAGTGYFDYALSSIDNKEGVISFVAAKSSALLNDPEAKVSCPDGTYTLAGIRFKVVDTGVSKLRIDHGTGDSTNTEIFCGSAEEVATVTDKTAELFRLGLAKVTQLTGPESIHVYVDTPLNDVVAELPEKIPAVFDDATEDSVSVTWTSNDYQAEVPGDYTFTGTVNDSSVDANGQTTSVTVTVDKLEIASISNPVVDVPYDATTEQVRVLLPSKVKVQLQNQTSTDLPVTWNDFEYAPGITLGELGIVGEVDCGTKYINSLTGEAGLSRANLNISAKVRNNAVGTVGDEIADQIVAYDSASKEDVIGTLPKTVTLNLTYPAADNTDPHDSVFFHGPSEVTAFVQWDSQDYNRTKAGTYTFTGTITVPENVTMESNTITVNVTVSEAKVKKVVKVLEDLVDKTTNTSSTLKLVSLYSGKIEVEYQDGTTGSEAIVWDKASKNLNAKTKGEYTLTGTVGDVPVQVKVTVKAADTNNNKNNSDNTSSVLIYMNNKIVNNTTQTVFTGQVIKLRASETVKWSSTNKSIAMVTEDGKLVANAPGTVTITAVGSSSAAQFTLRVALNPTTIATIADEDDDLEELEIPFTDLADYSWATRMICKLAKDGIVSGKTATTYCPGDPVTRAEYASMLVRALKLTSSVDGVEFDDVAEGAWYYETVRIASALKVVSGYGDGTFRPDNTITREEMAVMTQKAAVAAGITLPTLVNVNFTDKDQIADWAKDSVNLLTCAQVINGMGDGTFNPKGTANRAQAAVIIYNLYRLK